MTPSLDPKLVDRREKGSSSGPCRCAVGLTLGSICVNKENEDQIEDFEFSCVHPSAHLAMDKAGSHVAFS